MTPRTTSATVTSTRQPIAARRTSQPGTSSDPARSGASTVGGGSEEAASLVMVAAGPSSRSNAGDATSHLEPIGDRWRPPPTSGTLRAMATRARRPVGRLPLSHRKSFVAHHTRLRPVSGVPGLRLHVAAETTPVWQATEEALGIAGAPIPFWAFAWAGGLALARYVVEHPHEVRDRTVFDFATGSGLVAIAAARA